MSKLREAAQAVSDMSHRDDPHLLDAILALRAVLAAPDETEAAVLAEREACARICEQLQDWPEGATPDDCAKAIRAGR